MNFLNLLIVVPLALLWAVLPTDSVALMADFVFKRLVDVTFELPFSRQMETEADEVIAKYFFPVNSQLSLFDEPCS